MDASERDGRDRERIGALVRQFEPFVSPNDVGFLHRVFDRGLAPYRDRIRQYGLCGRRHVLDAGCGYGQWSVALARENDRVTGIDVSAERLMFLEAAARDLGLGNVAVRRCDVWATDLPEASFDAVFCYGVIFLTPWKETLAEFARLLRPGGTLYVNANGFGWYRHLWRTGHNANPSYDPRMKAATVLLNTLRYERGQPLEPRCDILIEPEAMTVELERLGFFDIARGGEGTLVATGAERLSNPFFQAEYDGDVGVYEILARKRS